MYFVASYIYRGVHMLSVSLRLRLCSHPKRLVLPVRRVSQLYFIHLAKSLSHNDSNLSLHCDRYLRGSPRTRLTVEREYSNDSFDYLFST